MLQTEPQNTYFAQRFCNFVQFLHMLKDSYVIVILDLSCTAEKQYMLSNNLEQNTSYEDDSGSTSPKIPCLLWKLKFQ